MTATLDLAGLLVEYDRALSYTDALWRDLSAEEIRWRPRRDFSPIGWHVGHQAAVAHFMVRNLVAAEPGPDPALEPLMDSANPEADRGDPPDPERLAGFRSAVAERVRVRLGEIEHGDVGAPAQLGVVGRHVLVALINHEYQHDQWIAEVRDGQLGHRLPPRPRSEHLAEIDGYPVLVG